MQPTKIRQVLFLGEQDGAGERELKTVLSECFLSNGGVDTAYLARVSFGEVPTPHVALCVRGCEERTVALVECVGKAFSKLFRTTQHLDILFLSEAQLVEITRVAKPFYRVSS